MVQYHYCVVRVRAPNKVQLYEELRHCYNFFVSINNLAAQPPPPCSAPFLSL